MNSAALLPFDFGRVVNAIQKVEERLARATAALEVAGVPYAVVGGNAVANWMARVDPAAVRFTKDVDLLLHRRDLPAAIAALSAAGFVHRHAAGVDFFLDEPDGRFAEAVHLVFAGEKVREDYVAPAPDVSESERAAAFSIATLDALVRMKLTAFRDRDRTHLRDMIAVGLIDQTWPGRFQPELAKRLQFLLDNPED
jgi:hypothetical protein